jgi:hypothetical protein
VISQDDISAGALIAGQVESLERFALGEIFLERGTVSRESLEFVGGYDDDRVLAASNDLWTLGEGEVHDLAEPVLGIGEIPFHEAASQIS